MNKIKKAATSLKNLWSTPLEGRYLNIKETLCFGFYAMGGNWLTAAMNCIVTVTYIPYFYQINAIHGYIIVISGTILNMILQPILGKAMDKTNTKLGRYKPYIMLILPLLALFVVMSSWLPQFTEETYRIIFAYISCIPVLCLSIFASNMYQTMPNIITPNSQERADIMTPISMIGGLGGTLLQLLSGPIRAHYIALGKEYMAMRVIGVVSSVIGLLLAIFIIKVKERTYIQENEEKENLSFKDAIIVIKNNKSLLIVAFALALSSLREFWRLFLPMIIQFRYSGSVTKALNISGIPLLIIGFASTIAMLLFTYLSRKLDNKKIIIIFTIVNIIPLASIGLIGIQNIKIGTVSAVVLTILFFISGMSPVFLIIPLLLGELSDYQQSLNGKRMEGYFQMLVFSFPLLVSQVLMLLASFVQKHIGFEQKDYANIETLTNQQQSVVCNWFNIVVLISAVSCLVLAAIISFYPISKAKHEEILNKLKENSKIEEI